MMESKAFNLAYKQARENDQPELLIKAIPYASFLGMEAVKHESGWQFYLPPKRSNVGNPVLPALHGGAIAGFMEMSAVIYMFMNIDIAQVCGSEPRVPKIIDFSIDYVRACRFIPTHAACEVVRQGRKITNAVVRVWQDDPKKITASARAHYLLD